jgi:nitroreductase
MHVDEALKTRISCRAFRPDPVPESTVRAILEGAGCAPSGGNLQPWHVYALTGGPLSALLADIAERMSDLPRGEGQEYRVFPKDLKGPYASRRFKCGEDLYASINVARQQVRQAGAVQTEFRILRRTLCLSRPHHGAATMG